ncbi:hypothetical protein [Halomicrobium katesii]|uniref:hypothetical protein n=1 Tax=Halomicrobium katesii TaxID=437163 RepID=UPI0003658057|nr:hypothetical protein [Halomicrobium katesii]
MAEAAATSQSTRETIGRPTTTLTAWTLATTNTVGFVLAVLVPAYASGGLSDVLPSLNTAVGVAAFLALWLVVGVTTHWLLGHVDPSSDSPVRLTLWAGSCGALAGIVFLVGIVVGLGVPAAVVGSFGLRTVVLLAAVGTPVAAIVGAVVGIAAGLLDVVLLRIAGRVTPPSDRR